MFPNVLGKKGKISISRNGEEIEWRIAGFLSLPKTDGTWYYSPTFSFGSETWYLVISPNGWSAHNTCGHVDLYLFKNYSQRSIKQTFSLSLKTVKGEKYNEEYGTKDFEKWASYHGFVPFLARLELSRRQCELIPEGVLTVVCNMKNTMSAGSSTGKGLEQISENTSVEVCTQTEEENGEACASGSSISFHEKKLHDDLKELFLRKEDCDVIIKVKSLEIPVHRVILKARSPVFASTFRHDMKENATGVIEIEDCDPSSLSDFLHFLYCGDVGMISQENVFSLFTLTDKYEVLDLKATCLEFMKKNITVDTFCETITLALQHSETELIALATDFFVKNAEEILLTVKWQIYAAENPIESNELFIKFVKSVKHSKT